MFSRFRSRYEKSRGASRGCLHGGASFRVEMAHFAARKKGSGEPQKSSKSAPPSVPPPEALYEKMANKFPKIVFRVCFRDEHAGHVQEIILRFRFRNLTERESQVPGFVFSLVHCFCEDGLQEASAQVSL